MPQPESHAVTIFDVADEAGVSYATVSRVINNKAHVKPEKREAVLRAMARLGYVANQQARSLAGGRSRVIGLMASELSTGYMGKILQGIDEALAETEYDLLLYSTRRRTAREASYVASITRGLADGLLLVLPRNPASYLQSLRQRRFPYVLVDHQGIGAAEPAVGATNERGAYDATRYLIELGHRRIGFIGGDMSLRCAGDRLNGYRAALSAFGIAPDPQLIQPGDFMQPAAYQSARALLALPDSPTAIFASNDVTAFGAMDAARDMGLRIPDDISIVGFDDIAMSEMVTPKLTTVRQPLVAMGSAATRALLAMLEDPSLVCDRMDLPTELVIRGSAKVPA